MEVVIILPYLTSKERFEIQQSPFAPVRLCCPYHPHYYGLIRHPLACQPTSPFDLYKAYLAPDTSIRDEEGFPS